MNGFLLLDKKTGLNSFKLVVALRKIAGQKRVGFAGTLDPLATGLMILALGEYTKLLPYLEKADKKYEVKIELGKESDTFDSDGEITVINGYLEPTLEDVEKILKEKFLGKIIQIPPRFSAIKIGGKRAYDMARKGEKFEMKEREVEIFSIEVLEYDFPFLRLQIHCSSGTYIRSIAHDLGGILGCGGMVVELRRTAIGGADFDGFDVCKMEDLNAENIVEHFVEPVKLFGGMAKVELEQGEYDVLANGNFIENRFNLGEIALGYLKGELVGILKGVDGSNKLKFKKKLNIF